MVATVISATAISILLGGIVLLQKTKMHHQARTDALLFAHSRAARFFDGQLYPDAHLQAPGSSNTFSLPDDILLSDLLVVNHTESVSLSADGKVATFEMELAVATAHRASTRVTVSASRYR